MGFGDGEMQHIDMRISNAMWAASCQTSICLALDCIDAAIRLSRESALWTITTDNGLDLSYPASPSEFMTCLHGLTVVVNDSQLHGVGCLVFGQGSSRMSWARWECDPVQRHWLFVGSPVYAGRSRACHIQVRFSMHLSSHVCWAVNSDGHVQILRL